MTRPQWLPTRRDLPGIALAAVLGVVAIFVVRAAPKTPYLSDVLVALVLGALVLNTPLRRLFGLELPSDEREPDRYAPGLRFTNKWVLRLGIILMGLKVQTGFFGRVELLLIAGVAAVSLPSTFFVAQALGAKLGVRRPLADLLAGGTMICGASAVNAIAPLAGARREEQGIAIGVTFLFSIFALVTFRALAVALGLDPAFSGLWAGLAVNDLSSAVAVGSQMGGAGGVMATAAKSARVLLLAPTLLVFSLLRHDGRPRDVKKSIVDQLPRFVLGYLALAGVRAAGDRLFAAEPAWTAFLDGNKLAVDLLLATVAAGIGLHLALKKQLSSGARALAVGGGASLWMAALTFTMIVCAARGAYALSALVGSGALLVSFVAHRAAGSAEALLLRLRRRFEAGEPLSLGEAMRLLDRADAEHALDEPWLRRLLTQLHPSIGELIPVRERSLPHGEGCRWVTYWEGKSGWALVALCREPGSATPIHAHPHRLIGKTIEGVLEELRFSGNDGHVELTSRAVLGHNVLIETQALDTIHVVRVAGPGPAIDLQLRGPEVGKPGRRLRPRAPLDLAGLRVGDRIEVTEEVDDRPGHGGEGAGVGRVA